MKNISLMKLTMVLVTVEYDFTNKAFWRDALNLMAKSDEKYFDREELICTALSVAYDIDNKQPSKINDALEAQNAPIRVISIVETRGACRDKTYWQILFKDDPRVT